MQIQFSGEAQAFDRILMRLDGLSLKDTCTQIRAAFPSLSGKQARKLVIARTAALDYANQPTLYADPVGDIAVHRADTTSRR